MKKILLVALILILALAGFYYLKASQFYSNIYIKKATVKKPLPKKPNLMF